MRAGWLLVQSVIVCLVCAAHAASGSMFLSASELEDVRRESNTLRCSYSYVSGRSVTPHDEAISIDDAMTAISAFKQPSTSNYHHHRINNKLVVATDTHYGNDIIANIGSQFHCDFITMPLLTPRDYLCCEVHAVRGLFDVLMPVWTDPAIALGRYHTPDALSAHFGLHFMMSPAPLVSEFTNKSMFMSWMKNAGLGSFTPSTYTTEHDAVYPCMIKQTSGTHGVGIEVANSPAELRSAMLRLSEGGHSILIQEALLSNVEPIIHFIARNGKLLATSCLLHKEKESVYVTGAGSYQLRRGTTVSCHKLDAFSPLNAVTRRIIELNNFNGFGCINFKFAHVKFSEAALNKTLNDLIVSKTKLPESVTTVFGENADFANTWMEFGAIPKVCGAHTICLV